MPLRQVAGLYTTIVEINIYLAHGIRFGFPSIESFVFMAPVILQKEIKKFPRHTEITQNTMVKFYETEWYI